MCQKTTMNIDQATECWHDVRPMIPTTEDYSLSFLTLHKTPEATWHTIASCMSTLFGLLHESCSNSQTYEHEVFTLLISHTQIKI